MSSGRKARMLLSQGSRAAAGAQEIVRTVLGRLPTDLMVGTPPSAKLALDSYRQEAESYDRRTSWGAPYRRQAVAALSPSPGDVVLDVGCGTGLNFPLIEEAIGPRGRLIGIDQSPHMLARAQARVEAAGWQNVTLIASPAEEAESPAEPDAVLLCATHDVMRSPRALARVLRHARQGARVVAAGPKWTPWWAPGAPALNAAAWYVNRSYVTTFEGFARPWSHLGAFVSDLDVRPLCFGGGYVASGTVRRG